MEQDIRKVLLVSVESPWWQEALEAATAMPAIPAWLTNEYICSIDEEYALLGNRRNLVLDALSRVVSDPTLCTFAKALYYIIGLKKGYKHAFTQFHLSKTAESNLAGLFPILGHVAPSCETLSKRGVPADVIFDTLLFLRRSLSRSLDAETPRFGEIPFSYFPLYLYTDNLFMGRLRFEIHPEADRNVSIFADRSGDICILMQDTRLHVSGNRLGSIGCTDETGSFDADFVETDAYYEGYAVNKETGLVENNRTRLFKGQWQRLFAPGDTLLKVHIPYGGKLTKEACHASYEKARKVYRTCYPEYDFKGFVCDTWLLCPLMGSFLPKESNILQFQSDYRIFPAQNNAQDVLHYVYSIDVPSADLVDANSLPEDNSMRRGVKNLLLKGQYIHQFNGFIPF